jgi:hypothetical protein
MNLRAEAKRERQKNVVQLALADHQSRFEALKLGLLERGQRVLPVPLYVDYHSRLLDALDEGPLTADVFKRLHEGHTQVKTQADNLPPYKIPPGP